MTSVHTQEDTRIFHKECVSLAKAGYDVYLVSQGTQYDKSGVHLYGISKETSGKLSRIFVFSNKVYETALSIDADIYHLHDPELLIYASRLKKKGKTVIFDSHENSLEFIEDKQWIPAIFKGITSNFYRKYATNCFSKIDALITVSPHITEQLKKINPETYQVTNYPIYQDYDNKNRDFSKPILCFTGGISEQWSHELILDAIDDIDGVEYNLCGSAEENYIDSLKQKNGWCKVNYYGKVPFSQSVEIQMASNIGMALLKPSKNTGGMMGTIGNTKLFEFMMAGMPLICTGFDLWKEIINQYNCGICIDSLDKTTIKEAITYLMDHPNEAKTMGENGKRAAREVFNWETQESILLDLYKNLQNKGKFS